ncbi:MAG: cytochrome-c peroxidase, partial [Rhizobacter sp.]|nr:cytochrome-c peroxidase [Rhizobacter sp.]
NVARTAPYFHDGRVATLELALEQELLGQGSEQIPLAPEEKRVLLAFLRALNDDDK